MNSAVQKIVMKKITLKPSIAKIARPNSETLHNSGHYNDSDFYESLTQTQNFEITMPKSLLKTAYKPTLANHSISKIEEYKISPYMAEKDNTSKSRYRKIVISKSMAKSRSCENTELKTKPAKKF